MSRNNYEQYVLGSLLMEQDLFISETKNLQEKHFSGTNRKLLQDLKKYREHNETIDLSAFCAESGREIFTLTQYISATPNTGNFDLYKSNLQKHCAASELIKMFMRAREGIERDPLEAFNILNKIQTLSLVDSQEFRGKKGSVMLEEVCERMEHAAETGETPWTSPGIKGLDEFLQFQAGQLVLIGARPGVGKSMFAQNLMRKLLKISPVAFVGLEMTNDEVGDRLAVREAMERRDLLYTKEGAIKYKEKILEARKMYQNSTFYDDHMSIEDLNSVIRYEKRVNNIEYFIIDYVGLVGSSKMYRNKHEEASSISTRLKQYAQRHKVCIIGLTQLNREVEKRTTKEFKLSDISTTDKLSHDGNIIMFLDRGLEKQNAGGFEDVEVQDLKEDEMKVYITKSRSGKVGEVVLKCIPYLYYVDSKESYQSQTALSN